MRTYAGVCLLLVAFGSLSVHAQFVPVSAKIRFTFEGTKNGKVTRLVKEGMFYRTENGSTLKHWTNGDKEVMRSGSELFDNQTLYTYQIFYDAKTMMQSPIKVPAPRKPDEFMNMESLGKDTVQGIPCDVVAIDFAGQPGVKPHRVGGACISRDDGLWLRQETRDTRPDGKVVHTLEEMYDIKLNVPPDNNEFDVLRTFTIIKETGRPLPPPTLPE